MGLSVYHLVYHLKPSNKSGFRSNLRVDYYNHNAATQGGIVADIVGIVAYSAADCMEACAKMNIFANEWGFSTKCAGITFGKQMSSEYSRQGANCFLKNGTSVNPLSNVEALSASVVT